MVVIINGISLDWKAQEVLEAIVENGGTADTSEVKAYTGLERNEVIKYRFAKLSEAQLVETHQPPGDNGRPAAKVARLTNDGEQLVGEGGLEFAVEPGDDSLTVDERLERIEKQVGRWREMYGEVKRRIVELQEEVEQHDDDLDDLDRRLNSLITALEEAEEATNGA